ncbi:MAG TPA: serine/threonine-protein kinase, partial [Nannocystaceae bacterium]|nr:serine/threonine-protein kinase [Nannocystaceae bacterium]
MRDQAQTRREFVAPPPEQGIERERVFASLHERMFGSADPVTVGRFVVLAKIGVGAMGTVFAAYDPQLDRKVALKVLVAFADADASDRRDREARALARLRHPNVVAVHEVGNHRGERFIAMDLVDGVTLRAWLQTPRSWRATLDVLVQAGSALVAAHAAGIVHRDFKPDNVLVEHGHARVVDFGLSRPGASTGLATARGDGAPHETDFVVGTPAYMAPEAFSGKADEATDQYSYCATMYEALFGVRPFAGTSSEELQVEVRAQRVQRPASRRRVPGWLRRAVMRGLASDPAERWPSIAALLQALGRGRRRPLAAAITTAAIGGALAGALAMSASSAPPDRCRPTSTRLDEVWNDDTIAVIGAAFTATKLAYADETWRHAHDVIRQWTDAWNEQHHEACVATYEQGVQSEAMFDARMQCLDRRVDELASLAAALAQPDDTLVTRAVAASNGLGALEQCADLGALGRERVGPPAPPELYVRLAQAQTDRRLGRYAAALPDARALATTADAEGFVELAAAAQLACAALEEKAGELEAATRSVRIAIERADAIGDDALRAEAQVLMVAVLAQRDQLDAALEWVALTRATVERLGDPPRMRAALAGQEANVLHAAARFPEALERRREALALREEHGDELDPALADAHASLAVTLLEIGEPREAHEQLMRALDLRTRALGDRHPDIAHTREQIGNVLAHQGEID